MQVGVEIEIFLNAQVLVQTKSLGHIANAGLDLLGAGGYVDAQDTQIARIGPHQSSGQTNERGLSSSIRSDQRGERAAPDFQGYTVKRDRVLALIAMKRLMNIIADKRRCELAGRTHCWTFATAPIPENGRGRVSFVCR